MSLKKAAKRKFEIRNCFSLNFHVFKTKKMKTFVLKRQKLMKKIKIKKKKSQKK